MFCFRSQKIAFAADSVLVLWNWIRNEYQYFSVPNESNQLIKGLIFHPFNNDFIFSVSLDCINVWDIMAQNNLYNCIIQDDTNNSNQIKIALTSDANYLILFCNHILLAYQIFLPSFCDISMETNIRLLAKYKFATTKKHIINVKSFINDTRSVATLTVNNISLWQLQFQNGSSQSDIMHCRVKFCSNFYHQI